MDMILAFEYFKKLYERFLKIRGTPREIGLGFALGLLTESNEAESKKNAERNQKE